MRAPFAMDRHRGMPAHLGSRFDEAAATVASLQEEGRRLERLGLETPLARCHEQLRYWEFVKAMLSLPPGTEGSGR